MKKMVFFITGLLLIVMASFSVFSAPREIVLIRHADKWAQKDTGPFLSPKGQLRAERFAAYYLKCNPTWKSLSMAK